MRPIKFRGREKTKDGNLIYGNYARFKYTSDNVEGDFITDKHGDGFLVHPDSVAQFVGYAFNGEEIYEGDTVVDRLGIEYVARRITVFVNDKDCIENYDNGKSSFTLKQEADT